LAAFATSARAMFSTILDHEQLVALHSAFDKACVELGLGLTKRFVASNWNS
jgi:hypothetical protein